MLEFHIILMVVVVLTMVGLGLRVELSDILRSGRDWRALLLVVAGKFALIPFLAWLVIEATGAEGRHAVAVAVVLMGPGGETAAAAVFLAHASLPLAIVGIIVINLLSPLLSPYLIRLVAQMGEADAAIILPGFGDSVSAIFLLMMVPLAIGMTLRYAVPLASESLAGPFRVFIWVMYILTALYAVLLQGFLVREAQMGPMLPTLAGILAASLVAFALAYLFGLFARLRPESAVTMSFLVGLQSPGVGLYVLSHQEDAWPELITLSIGYAILLPVIVAIWVLLAGRRLRLPGLRR